MKRKSDRARTKPSGSQSVGEPFTQTEREGLRVLIEEVLRLSFFRSGEGSEQAMTAATPAPPQPGSAPQPEDQFTIVKRHLDGAIKRYESARSRWYKAQDEVRKRNPLDPTFTSAIAELHYSTMEYVETCHTLLSVDSGVVFG